MSMPKVGKPASFTDIAFDSGVIWERERHAQWLDRVRTWNPEKSENWLEGYEAAQNRIIKLLEDPMTMNRWWGKPDESLGLYGNLAQYVIELIKEDPK